MDEIVAKVSKIPIAQRLLAVVAAVVVLLVGNYLVFVTPLEDEIAASQKRIDQLAETLVQERAIAHGLARYRVEVERLKQRLNEALTLLPNDAETPGLLQKLAALVEQSDWEMSVLEPQGEVVSGFYAKIPVKVQI